MKKINLKKIFLFGLPGLFGLCMLLVLISAISNARLPTQSQTIERLSEEQKAYLQEATHLRQVLGDQVWAGWGQVDIPNIVYNESYAFLVGYADPPEGWVKMPVGEQRGTAWQPVPQDTYLGEMYYRQALPDPQVNPEAFTVLVGERWVASLPTREYMEITFYEGFRSEVPAFLQPVLPYRLLYGMIMNSVETYVEGLNHEAFHAFEALTNRERFEKAEEIMGAEPAYPWDDDNLQASWKEEMELVLAALEADTDAAALELARQFWLHREARRRDFNLTAQQIELERQREWLEGLAKYSELALGRLAGASESYLPVSEIQDDPDFHSYTRQEAYWQQQLTEAAGSAVSSSESKFYYSGLVQAALLDRLSGDWKERILTTDLALEDLLRELTPVQP